VLVIVRQLSTSMAEPTRMQAGIAKIDPAGRHVVIVEDIVDSGRTLQRLRQDTLAAGAASMAVVALLDKAARRTVDVSIEYRGFECPDEFVVGCGRSLAHQQMLHSEQARRQVTQRFA
jgi:hypoxanthine phosphoribosyltransferase